MKRFLCLTAIFAMCFVCSFAEEAWTCPQCSAENTTNFCIKCGTRKPDEIVCPNCGEKYKADSEALYCGNCGTKLDQKSNDDSSGNSAADINPADLAGTWKGTGTPKNGGTAIELEVTIHENGSGEYTFVQGSYIETFPFLLSYQDQTFSVTVSPESGISAVTGTYRLNESNHLELDITTSLLSGRTYSYTAECLKTSDVSDELSDKTETIGIALAGGGIFVNTQKGNSYHVGQYVDLGLIPEGGLAGVYYSLDYSQNFPEGCEFSLVYPDGSVSKRRDGDLKDAEGKRYIYETSAMPLEKLIPGEYAFFCGNTLLGKFTITIQKSNIEHSTVSYEGPVYVSKAGVGIQDKEGNRSFIPSLNVVPDHPDDEAVYGIRLAVVNNGEQLDNCIFLLNGTSDQYSTEIIYKVPSFGSGKTITLYSDKDVDQLPGMYTLKLNGVQIYQFAIAD